MGRILAIDYGKKRVGLAVSDPCGIIATGIGIMFSWENIGWLTIVTDTPEYNFTELLNIEKMLKWYALANIVALFPNAS